MGIYPPVGMMELRMKQHQEILTESQKSDGF